MSEDVKKIYEYVEKMEDYYYSLLSEGDNPTNDIMNSLQASSFQRVRYFIEDMLENES